MHDEWFVLGEAAARIVSETKREGRRVIAVGTTSCRVLESVAADQAYGDHDAPLQPASGEARSIHLPRIQIPVIDAMITNFHLPGSTLLHACLSAHGAGGNAGGLPGGCKRRIPLFQFWRRDASPAASGQIKTERIVAV